MVESETVRACDLYPNLLQGKPHLTHWVITFLDLESFKDLLKKGPSPKNYAHLDKTKNSYLKLTHGIVQEPRVTGQEKVLVLPLGTYDTNFLKIKSKNLGIRIRKHLLGKAKS